MGVHSCALSALGPTHSEVLEDCTTSPIMLKLVISLCLVCVALGQYRQQNQAATAKITKFSLSNDGSGRFGAAYAQNDGTVYKEETGPNGERKGQYSYVDQSGKTITVRYTAGKDGFRVQGDHVPSGGLTAAAYSPQQSQQYRPQQQQYQPQQQAHRFAQQTASSHDYDYFDGPLPNGRGNNAGYNSAPAQRTYAPAPQQAASNANPFINPYDSTHNDFRYNQNAGTYGGGSSSGPAYRTGAGVPPCADCAGVNPFINPYDNSHRNPQAYGVGASSSSSNKNKFNFNF